MEAATRPPVVPAAFASTFLAQSDAGKNVFDEIVKDSKASAVSWNFAALNGTLWSNSLIETIAIKVPAGKQVTITSRYSCAWESTVFTVIDGKRDPTGDTGRYKNGELPVTWTYANRTHKEVTVGLMTLYKKGDARDGVGLPWLYYEPSMVAVRAATKNEFTFELYHGGQKAKDHREIPSLRVVVTWRAAPR